MVREYVTGTFYPPVFDDSLPYTTQRVRAGISCGEMVITCNIQYLHDAVHVIFDHMHSTYTIGVLLAIAWSKHT